jgi:hypothetical protein
MNLFVLPMFGAFAQVFAEFIGIKLGKQLILIIEKYQRIKFVFKPNYFKI